MLRRLATRLGVFLAALVVAVASAELGLRALGVGTESFDHETWFEDVEHQRMDFADALARGDVVVGELPRGRARWAREHTFYICYRDGDRPSFDDRGCARVDINSLGIRDRRDLAYEKPTGRSRVLCLGDSFTFGWGVSVERTWVRQLEGRLGAQGDVRTINCGAAGALMIDEHWWGLRDRFGRFDPDVVLLSVCLNDLVPMPDTVGLFRSTVLRGCDRHGYRLDWTCADCVDRARSLDARHKWTSRSRLLAVLLGSLDLRTRLDLDPRVDWGRWLLDMPSGWPAPLDPQGRSFYQLQGMPEEASWRGGGPQSALRAMRGWCAERGVALGVVVWPLFQGLESPTNYPFGELHRVIVEFCTNENIPSLDLLPTFLGADSASLWVDPCDMHANEDAHQMAVGPIAGFVESFWPDDH